MASGCRPDSKGMSRGTKGKREEKTLNHARTPVHVLARKVVSLWNYSPPCPRSSTQLSRTCVGGDLR